MNPLIGLLRLWAVTAATIPVVLGAVLAAATGHFSWVILTVTLLSGLFLQTACNVLNSYGDYLSGVDTVEHPPNAPQIVYHQVTLRTALYIGSTLLLLGTLFGIIAAALSSWHLLWFAAAGIAGTALYTTGIRYKYLGVGVPLVMLLMGILMVLASYYAHTTTLSWRALLVSLPVACHVGVILHGNDLRDVKRDKLANIKTTAILLGAKRAPQLFVALHLLPYLIIVGSVLLHLLSPWTLLTLLCLPLSRKIIVACQAHQLEILEGQSAAIHAVFGTLLILGLSLSLL